MEKSILCVLLSIFLFLFVRSAIALEANGADIEQLLQNLSFLKAMFEGVEAKEEKHKYNGDVTAYSEKNVSNEEEQNIENNNNNVKQVEQTYSNKEEKNVNKEEKNVNTEEQQKKLRQGGFRLPLFDAFAGYAENLTQHPGAGGGLDLMNAANIGNLGNLGIFNPERIQSLSIFNPERIQSLGIFNPERIQSLGLLGGNDNLSQISKNFVNTLQNGPLGTALNGSNFKKLAEGFLNPASFFNNREAARNM